MLKFFKKMKIKYILLSISAGLLTAASFPKIDLFFLIWIAFIPLIYIICKDDRTDSSIAAQSEQRNDDNNDEDGKDTSHLEDSSHPRVKVNPTLIIKLFLAFKDFCFHKHDNETPNTGKSIFLYGLISGFVLYAA
ncbi:MAG: hypothetical protein LBV66_02710, partial [Elusimicrobiota bacterium]|nr:hypothetical protein [Elusimicrobiota bacterium]